MDYSRQIEKIGPEKTSYTSVSTLDAFQTGAYAGIEPVFEELITVVNEEMDAFTSQRLDSARTRLVWLYSTVGDMAVVLTGFILYISASISRPLLPG